MFYIISQISVFLTFLEHNFILVTIQYIIISLHFKKEQYGFDREKLNILDIMYKSCKLEMWRQCLQQPFTICHLSTLHCETLGNLSYAARLQET